MNNRQKHRKEAHNFIHCGLCGRRIKMKNSILVKEENGTMYKVCAQCNSYRQQQVNSERINEIIAKG